MKNASIDLLTTPNEFFQQLVVKAISSQKVETTEAVTYYLVQLLSQFLQTAQLKELASTPLALKMHSATLSPPEEQLHVFKQLGDYSLYTAGFFSESFKRKIIDVDYYIKMGALAYLNVAVLQTKKEIQKLYKDLSNKFPNYVEVLSEVSHQTQISSEYNDILRLYEKWLKTKSPHLLNILLKHGVIPPEALDTDFDQ